MNVDSELDKLRVVEAMRRGWVQQEQVEACLLDLDTEDSIVEALARRGLLTREQVSALRDEVASGPTKREPPRSAGVNDPGEVLGEGDVIAERYRVEKIRHGGFGRVFLCTDSITGKRVALKTLLREHLGTERLVELFRREILLWIQLGEHPNIVLAYGMEEFMRLPFVVMEWVDGGSLEDLALGGGMTWQEAAGFGWQIANGLEHGRQTCGLIHRDLKPANVLLTREGTAKVTDFGISLVRGAQGKEFPGTPPYMAPEQWERRPDVDVRSDVYAFGVTLFELACGQRPFAEHGGQSLEAYRTAHLTQSPPDPRKLAPQMPEAMARLILRCLEKDRERRPANFAEVMRELAAFAGSIPVSAADTPDQVGGLVNQSKSYNLLGKFAEAERTAREAVKLDPGHSNARCALGNALGEQGKFGEALKQFEEAHRLDRENPVAIVNMARFANLAGDRAMAERWLDKGLATLEPQYMEGVSIQLVEYGRIPEAIGLCRQIVAQNPLAVMAWNTLAVGYRRTGELQQALECATKSVEINPRYAKGWSNRATVLVQMGRLEDGIASAERALEHEPATAGAYAAKAAALGQLGRIAEGRACLLRGLEVIPGNELLMRALGQFR